MNEIDTKVISYIVRARDNILRSKDLDGFSIGTHSDLCEVAKLIQAEEHYQGSKVNINGEYQIVPNYKWEKATERYDTTGTPPHIRDSNVTGDFINANKE